MGVACDAIDQNLEQRLRGDLDPDILRHFPRSGLPHRNDWIGTGAFVESLERRGSRQRRVARYQTAVKMDDDRLTGGAGVLKRFRHGGAVAHQAAFVDVQDVIEIHIRNYMALGTLPSMPRNDLARRTRISDHRGGVNEKRAGQHRTKDVRTSDPVVHESIAHRDDAHTRAAARASSDLPRPSGRVRVLLPLRRNCREAMKGRELRER